MDDTHLPGSFLYPYLGHIWLGTLGKLGGYQRAKARMDWSVTSNYTDAGATVQLDATGSDDPDGNAVSYNWYFYDEPSSHDGTVSVRNGSSSSTEVAVPSDASGKNIHVILEVTDNGEPNLTSYRRIIRRINPKKNNNTQRKFS